MKKNEKNFMQNEADLEKVAGGSMASGIEVDQNIKLRDVNAKLELIKNQKIEANQAVNGDYNETYNMGTNTING